MTSSRKGHCVICDGRVFSDEEYIESSEGYCHVKCLMESSVIEREGNATKKAA